MALKLKKVPYVMLSVASVEKTLAFYTENLGLEVGYHDRNWAELKTDSFVLALHQSDKPATAEQLAAGPIVIFGSDDIVADRQALLAMDIQVSPLHQVAEAPDDTVGISCDFTDPNGQPLSLFAHLGRSQWEALQNA